MNIEVKLDKHEGQYFNREWQRVFTVEHNQWKVMISIDGSPYRQVGYLGKQANAPFNGIPALTSLPSNVRDEVHRKLSVLVGYTPKMYMPAPFSRELLESVGIDPDEGDNEEE